MRLLVPRQIAKQSKFLRAVFTGEVSHGVAQQVLLIVALVPEDLVAGLADELQFGFFFLHLLQGRGTDSHC